MAGAAEGAHPQTLRQKDRTHRKTPSLTEQRVFRTLESGSSTSRLPTEGARANQRNLSGIEDRGATHLPRI
jgi:hypothetical protein